MGIRRSLLVPGQGLGHVPQLAEGLDEALARDDLGQGGRLGRRDHTGEGSIRREGAPPVTSPVTTMARWENPRASPDSRFVGPGGTPLRHPRGGSGG